MRFVALSFICVFPISALGQNAGLEDTNYFIGVSADHQDSGNIFSLSGGARYPLTAYTGLFFNASLSNHKGKNNYLDSSSKAGGLGIFFRKYDTGIVQASYQYSSSEADIAPGTLSNSIKTYTVSGTYYINKLDLSLVRAESKPGAGTSIQSSSVGAAYYLSNNLSFSGFIGGMDADESYSLSATYQPRLFNNAVSLSIRYHDSKTIDGFAVSLMYYFDTRVSLLDRNRKY